MKDTVTRFTWGDYIGLSYTWGDYAGQQATIFLDGIARAVSKHLEVALQDLQESPEYQLGMKVRGWTPSALTKPTLLTGIPTSYV